MQFLYLGPDEKGNIEVAYRMPQEYFLPYYFAFDAYASFQIVNSWVLLSETGWETKVAVTAISAVKQLMAEYRVHTYTLNAYCHGVPLKVIFDFDKEKMFLLFKDFRYSFLETMENEVQKHLKL